MQCEIREGWNIVPIHRMVREDVAAKQVVPFEDECNHGQSGQHVLMEAIYGRN